MKKALQCRRLLMVTALVVLAYCAVGWRLVDLQVLNPIQPSEIQLAAEREVDVLPAVRGNIFDRKGGYLAMTHSVVDFGADPTFIRPFEDEVARIIGPRIGKDPAEIAMTIRLASGQYVSLGRKVPFLVWRDIQARLLELEIDSERLVAVGRGNLFLNNLRSRAVYAESIIQERINPHGYVAGQLLGYVRAVNVEYGDDRELPVLRGQGGLELFYDRSIRGTPGWRTKAKSGGVSTVEHQVEPRDGLNLITTIDLAVQEMVEKELRWATNQYKPDHVSAIVMDVRNGDVLAVATAPGFDPQRFTAGQLEENSRNASFLEVFEPGSTFKIAAAAGALDAGLATLDTPIDCTSNGYLPYSVGRVRVRGITDEHALGVVPVRTVLSQSSNIGAHMLAKMQGARTFYESIVRFGFGERTGIDLPENSGKLRRLEDWDGMSMRSLPMGYEVSVTQVQLAAAYSAIANGGILYKPRIVSRLTDHSGNVVQEIPTVAMRRVIKPETAAALTEALTAVTQEGGTALNASLEHYSVAGKTGTAQAWVPGIGYDHEKFYDASFVGFLPASDPRICIVVTVFKPDLDKVERRFRFGGQSAAPVFKRIAGSAVNLLNIPQDIFPAEGASGEMSFTVNGNY